MLSQENSSQVWKLWTQTVAQAWLDNEFKQELLANPEKVLVARGITIPDDIEVEVNEVEESKSFEPVKLVIPNGVPINIPYNIKLKIQKDSTTENLFVNFEFPGVVEVDSTPTSNKLKLILQFGPKPSDYWTDEKLKKVIWGIEEVNETDIGSEGSCNPVL